MITCGHCKGQHKTVQEVRDCAGVVHAHIKTGNVVMHEPKSKATDKQVSFLRALLTERPTWTTGVGITDVEALLAVATKEQASVMIEQALQVKKEVDTKAASLPDVPEGYYAVNIDDTVKFYRVDKPKEGKWAGRTFVAVQASDEFWPLRKHDERKRVLDTIVEQGVQVCLKRYGLLLGRCGICNRTLTDETSRAIGIGPVCRDKL